MNIVPLSQVHAITAYRKSEDNKARYEERDKGRAEGDATARNHYNNDRSSAKRFLTRMDERSIDTKTNESVSSEDKGSILDLVA